MYLNRAHTSAQNPLGSSEPQSELGSNKFASPSVTLIHVLSWWLSTQVQIPTPPFTNQLTLTKLFKTKSPKTCLCLSFLICDMGIIILPISQNSRDDQKVYIFQVLSHTLSTRQVQVIIS